VPYNNIEEFAAAVAVANNRRQYMTRGGAPVAIPGDVNDQNLINAWNVYRHAQQTNLESLVLGRWVPAPHDYPGIDQTVVANFVRMNEVDYGGSVMNSDNWTLLMNDAWVLGGVHSHTDFYLASRRIPANIEAAVPYGITVTGRELLGLVTFGYEFVQGHPDLGEAARVANAAAANNATFDAYVQAAGNAVVDGVLQGATLNALTAAPNPV
jgi:hypothetical protein